jgi:hypothetical protein
MGLGIGIHCETCGNQLYYDDDCEEIISHTEIVNGEQVITKRPVLCHRCKMAVVAFCKRISGEG